MTRRLYDAVVAESHHPAQMKPAGISDSRSAPTAARFFSDARERNALCHFDDVRIEDPSRCHALCCPPPRRAPAVPPVERCAPTAPLHHDRAERAELPMAPLPPTDAPTDRTTPRKTYAVAPIGDVTECDHEPDRRRTRVIVVTELPTVGVVGALVDLFA